MTARPQDNGVAHNDNGFQKRLLFAHVLGAQGIKRGQLFLRLALDVVEAAPEHLGIVMNPLDGRAEGRGFINNETGDKTFRIVVGQLVYFRRQRGVEIFMVRLAFPVGGDFLHHAPGVAFRDVRRGLLAGGQIAYGDIQKVPVQFGIQNAVAAVAARAAEQELIFLHAHGDVFRNVHQGFGPAQSKMLAFRLPHGFGEIQCALDVDARLLSVKPFQQAEHAGMSFAEMVFLALNLFLQAFFLWGEAGACAGDCVHDPTPYCLQCCVDE